MFRRFGLEYGHAPSVMPARDNGMIALLRYWGLIQELTETRPDGGRAGWWRVTQLGADWIDERATVPRYVDLFDARLVRGPYGPATGIRYSLGKKFDLEELMNG
jgi:hypothetical protein